MRANLLLVLAAGFFVLAPATAGAGPNRCTWKSDTTMMAAIGDSISVGCDAWDDACGTMVEYAGRLGNDWQSSWTIGDLNSNNAPNGYSIKKRLSAINGRTLSVLMPGADSGGDNRNNVDDSGYARLDTNGTVGSETYKYTSLSGAFDSPIIAPKNGASWDDAPAQAQAIVTSCYSYGRCPQVVTVFLGGNDVCKGTCAELPTYAQLDGWMTQTFNTLGQLPAGTEIWVNSLVNFNNYKYPAKWNGVTYQTTPLAQKRNFVFRTCQDMWDLNLNAIDLIAPCDNGIMGALCDLGIALAEILVNFVDFLTGGLINMLGVKFPCWTALGSASTCKPESSTPVTITVNNNINSLLVSKICQGVDTDAYCAAGKQWGNVKLFLGRSAKNSDFLDKQVSTLDCFHPNRQGQEFIATKMWKDMCEPGINAPIQCSGPSPTVAASVYNAYDSTNGYHNRITVTSTCNRSKVRVFIRLGSSPDGYDKKIIETETFGDVHNMPFKAPSAGYWKVYYELVDELQDYGAYVSGDYSTMKGRRAPADTSYHVLPTQIGLGQMYLY